MPTFGILVTTPILVSTPLAGKKKHPIPKNHHEKKPIFYPVSGK